MTRHNWVAVRRKSVALFRCGALDTYHNRSDADCFNCDVEVTRGELVKWSRFLPRELNEALDQIVATRQQVAAEVEAL